MAETPNLLDAFLESARRPAGAQREALGATLEALWGRAHQAWPDLGVTAVDFVRYLAERLPGGDVLDALTTVQPEDLCLAMACGRNDEKALATLDQRHLREVADFIATVDSSPAFAEEVRQALREKLFIGTREGRPKILEYTGRGALGGWIRMAAVRTALNLRRQPAARGEGELEDLLADQVDPELEAIKRQAAEELAAALREALAALAADDRTLLKLHHVDGLNIDELAPIYSTHRSTVARRLTKARERVMDDTCRLLQERLGASASELKSLIRLAKSQLDVSILRLLREG